MGGEQYSVLMYGPKVNYSFRKWIERFNLINKKEWVKEFMKVNYEEPYCDEEGINIVFNQEFDNYMYYDLLVNNCLWEEPFIGMKVKEYNTFNKQQAVIDFCDKYSLPKPTFYAGMA